MATTNYYTLDGAIVAEDQIGGTGYRSYGPDALGSVIATYDNTGNAQDTFRYSPYGRSLLQAVLYQPPLGIRRDHDVN